MHPDKRSIGRVFRFWGYRFCNGVSGKTIAKFCGLLSRAQWSPNEANPRMQPGHGSLYVDVEATYGSEDIKQVVAHASKEARSGKVLITPKTR